MTEIWGPKEHGNKRKETQLDAFVQFIEYTYTTL